MCLLIKEWHSHESNSALWSVTWSQKQHLERESRDTLHIKLSMSRVWPWRQTVPRDIGALSELREYMSYVMRKSNWQNIHPSQYICGTHDDHLISSAKSRNTELAIIWVISTKSKTYLFHSLSSTNIFSTESFVRWVSGFRYTSSLILPYLSHIEGHKA